MTKEIFDDLIIQGSISTDETLTVNQLKIFTNDDTDFSIVLGDTTAGVNLTTGASGNIVIGNNALIMSTGADNNIAIGTNALEVNTSSGRNIAIGNDAGALNTGTNSIFVGVQAGANHVGGNNCTFLGSASEGTAADANQISIGYQATCDVPNQCTIGNAALTIIRPGDDNGVDLGESDRQFKDLYLGGTANLDKLVMTQGTPASAAATGVAGTLLYDANFIYICHTTDIWKRVAIASW